MRSAARLEPINWTIMFHYDKYVTAKLGAARGESPGNPWDWKTAQERARRSALATDFWSGAPITDMGESSMLRPGEMFLSARLNW